MVVVPLFDFCDVVPFDVGTSKVVAVAGITVAAVAVTAGEFIVGTEFDVVGNCCVIIDGTAKEKEKTEEETSM